MELINFSADDRLNLLYLLLPKRKPWLWPAQTALLRELAGQVLMVIRHLTLELPGDVGVLDCLAFEEAVSVGACFVLVLEDDPAELTSDASFQSLHEGWRSS